MNTRTSLVLCLAANFLLIGARAAPPIESRVRVLLVRDSDTAHAVEEAGSLSLDQPAYESQNDTRIDPRGNNQTSYRQMTLASLTLQQRSPVRRHAPANESSHNEVNKTSSQVPRYPDPWHELYLARHKPSWLNVSSQFKVDGSNVSEVLMLMPPEYLLRAAFDSPILLKTRLGILEGVRSIKFNKQLFTFLSVPYAKPPIDELRFKAPLLVEKWDGIQQATKWPPFCVQPSMTLASKSSPVHVLSQVMSEDCLYLNIWTPSLKFNKNYKRPVMVWLHGGAFQYGGTSVDENEGSALALLGDVVVVTLNYRISALGFLNANNPREAPNNVGLLDQRLALEWVQANIRQFGGDPQQVTLFGESAGGHSVGLHLISPKSYHLFKRAIMQSGVPTSFLRSYDVNKDTPKGTNLGEGTASVMLARRLKCYLPSNDALAAAETSISTATDTRIINDSETTIEPIGDVVNGTAAAELLDYEAQDQADGPYLNDASIECMRNKTSLEILLAMGAPGNAGFFPTGNDAKGFFPNGPVMESFDADAPKVGPQKDVLIGTNTDEGSFMLHYGMPRLFPAKSAPLVSSIETLKAAIVDEIDKMSREAEQKVNSTSHSGLPTEVRVATSANGGAQSHLYKPLLKTSTSVLEGFMPKTNVRVLENGTVVGNTTAYSKEAEFGKGVASLITDIIFLCPARALARTLAEHRRNVYFYLFGHKSSLSTYHDWIGVTHHDEVEFVFGRPLRLADTYTGQDVEMSQRLIKAWAQFARTGTMPDQLGVKWPKYDTENNQYMTLMADKASVGERYHDRVCNIYETVISVHLQDR